MQLDVVQRIRQAEDEAADIRRKAAADAREAVRSATARLECERDARIKAAWAAANAQVAQAEKAAGEKARALMEDNGAQCRQIEALASARMDSAVSLILDRIVNG